jgi:hypothetical protein
MCSAQLLEERQHREELGAQLQKGAENNKNLARHNTRLLQAAERLKSQGEVALHELHTRSAAFKVREAETAVKIGRLQCALEGSAAQLRELQLQLEAKQARTGRSILHSSALTNLAILMG